MTTELSKSYVKRSLNHVIAHIHFNSVANFR